MENTTKNNKLIAEFIGLGKVEPYYIEDENNQETNLVFSADLKYNSDWNWLMEVVQKIENLGYYTNSDMDFTGSDNKTVMHFFRVYNNDNKGVVAFAKSTSKIESIYTAVVEFIKWYNLNK